MTLNEAQELVGKAANLVAEKERELNPFMGARGFLCAPSTFRGCADRLEEYLNKIRQIEAPIADEPARERILAAAKAMGIQ